MIDKDILEGLAELNETDLKRIKLLVDNKLNLHKDINVSYRSKNINAVKNHAKNVHTVLIGMLNGQKMEKEEQNTWEKP